MDLPCPPRLPVRCVSLVAIFCAITLAAADAAIDQRPAIQQAATSYLQKSNPRLKPSVRIERVEGDFASALITTRGLDNSTAFLRRKKGAWTVVSIGTGFDRAFYRREGIPVALQVDQATPVAPAQPRAITLSRKPGNRAIGVEPQGGRFAAVLRPGENSTGSYVFSTYGKKQADSILAVYATNAARIPLDRPLARVRISGLKTGETERRIRVEMTRQTDGRLSIAATDLKDKTALAVTQLEDRDLRTARLRLPAETTPGTRPVTPLRPDLPRLALGPNPVPARTPAALGRYIGVRGAGGIFTPVLRPTDTPDSTASKPRTTFVSTSVPGQRTADVHLFSGDSPYIEKTRHYARYIISEIQPTAGEVRRIRMEFTVGPRGTINTNAFDVRTNAQLRVDKYSTSALTRLRDLGLVNEYAPDGGEATGGRIPGDPNR